jgi:hypothetical protein
MKQEMNQSKRKPRHPDRVTLSPENLEKIAGWLNQICSANLGARLTRNDVVNWIISSQPVELSQQDVKHIGEKFFDEMYLLRQAIKEMKVRRQRGDAVNLADLIWHKAKAPTPVRRRKKENPTTETLETTPPQTANIS